MKVHKKLLTEEIEKTIFQGFREYDIDSCGITAIEKPISFYLTDQQGKLISAVVVRLFWGVMHIKYVWTHKEHRNKGYATKLMNTALDFARKKKCPFAHLETMNFQAPNFYKKFGFKIEFKRGGYMLENSFYYMRKDL